MSSSENVSTGGATRDGVQAQGAPRQRRLGALGWVIAVVFGLLFAYDVWEAVGNLVGVVSGASALDASISGFGWAVLIIGILAPIGLFFLALTVARGRDVLAQLLVFATAFGVSAILFLSTISLFGLGSLIS